MKIWITFSLLLLIISCNSSVSNKKIVLFNNYNFNLLINEEEAKITAVVKNSYFDYIKNKEVQIPLFKYVKNEKYNIYIGLPFNSTMKKINCTNIFHDSLCIESLTNDSLFGFKKYKINQNYITELTLQKNGGLIYILSATQSEVVSDSLFNFEKLNARINIQ